MKNIIVTNKINELSSEVLVKIKRFLVGCFLDNPDYEKSVYTNPDLDSCVLLYQDNELIGHVGITRREINHNEKQFIIAGIGDVAIKPELRHSGLGILILKELREVLESQDFDIGVLFCHPKLHDFYTKSGWQKKEKGKIFAKRKGILEDQRLTYLLPLKLDKTETNIWNNENINVGSGSW